MPTGLGFRPVALVVLLVIGVLALSACGGGEGGAETPTTTSIPSPTQPPPILETPTEVVVAPQPQRPATAQEIQSEVTEPDPVRFRLEIGAADNLFTKNNLRIRSGDPVTLFIANEGNNQHTLRIAGVDGQYETGDDIATVPITPGSIDGRSLEELMVPGTYSFRCDVHPQQMFGQITVVD